MQLLLKNFGAVTKQLMQSVNGLALSTDSYYRDYSLTLEQKEDIKNKGYQSKHFVNWDDPQEINAN